MSLKKKKVIVAVSAVCLFFCIALSGLLMNKNKYAYASDNNLYYTIAQDYQLADSGEMIVSFQAKEKNRTLIIPEYQYFDFEKDVYEGRILQAVPDDQNGIFSARLIKETEKWDLPPVIEDQLSGAVFEIYYYEDNAEDLYAIYLPADEKIISYIEAHYEKDVEESSVATARERMSGIRNFLRTNPVVFAPSGNRIDRYPQGFRRMNVQSVSDSSDITQPYEYNPGDFDEYTNEEDYFNGSGKSLKDYEYGSNLGTGTDGNYTTNDDIIQLVPIELFRHRGKYVYVGKEYGFFVVTEFNLDYGGRSNVVDVGVFDIIYKDSPLINVVSEIETSVEIKFLWHHTYSYLVREDVSDWDMIYDNQADEIVTTSRWEGAEEFYLYNVSFAAAIFDEIKLNPGQEGYTIEGDTSAHFIQSRYNFHGSSLKNANGYAFIKAVLGTAAKLKEAPGIVGVFGKIFHVASTAISVSDKINAVSDLFKVEYNDVSMDNEANIQVADYCPDEYCRTMASIISTPANGDTALLREGEDCENIYLLGNYKNNWTRIIHSFNLQVGRLDTGALGTSRNLEYISEAGSTYSRHIEDKELVDTPLELGQDIETSILFGATRRYKFTAEYAGTYTFISNSDNNLNFVICDSQYNIIDTSENTKSIVFEVSDDGNVYYLDVGLYNPELTEVISVDLDLENLKPGEAKNVTVKESTKSAVSFTVSESVPLYFNLNNSNLRLQIKTPDELIEFQRGSENNYYYFRKDINYQIIAVNDSATSQEARFLAEELPELVQEESLMLEFLPGSTYFSIENNSTETKTYVVSATEMEGKSFSWDVKTENWQDGAGTIYSDLGIIKISLLSGEINYIGLNNLSGKPIASEIQIQEEKNTFKWYANGKEIEDRELYLKRGESANIEFKVNNLSEETFNYQANGIFILDNNNVLTIKENSSLGGKEYIYAFGITDYPLTVHPLYEENFTYDIKNDDELYLTWGEFNGLDTVSYTVISPDGKKSYSEEVTGLYGKTSGVSYIIEKNSASEDGFYSKIFSKLNYRKAGECSIEINYIEIKTSGSSASYRIDNGSRELDVSVKKFNPLFGGGQGTADEPYDINCLRHLININYNYILAESDEDVIGNRTITGNYILRRSIYSMEAWRPIGYGYYTNAMQFDGNGYTISVDFGVEKISSNNSMYVGVFAILGGTVTDLNVVTGGLIEYNSSALLSMGGVVGYNRGRIENCSVSGVMKAYFANTNSQSSACLGGIAGINHGTIIDCTHGGTLNATRVSVGGIAGDNYGIIERCSSIANIYGNRDMGGIAATMNDSDARIKNCTFSGVVQYTGVSRFSDHDKIGGVVGQLIGGTISNTNAQSGSVICSISDPKSTTYQPYMGGLIGQKVGGTYTSSFGCNTTNFSKLVVVKYGFLGLKKFDQGAYARTIVGNPNVGYFPSSNSVVLEYETEENVS